jgi:hypothetical protein
MLPFHAPRALLAASLVALAACGSGDSLNPFGESVELPCPYVRVLAEGRVYRRHTAGSAVEAGTLELEAQVMAAESNCDYDDSDEPRSAMELDLALVFGAQRGPAAIPADAERLTYFVALVGPDRAVVNKQLFEVVIPFSEPGQSVALTEPEEITLSFPAGAETAPWAYSVVVGFQLTPEQLEGARDSAR